MRKLSLRLLAVAFMIFSAAHSSNSSSADSISSADLPLEARNSDSSSQEEDLISSGYVLPNQIFNDGKPYYVGKDPISGQPDFNAKKSAGIETSANEVFDPKEKIVLSSSSPNIHDFLNLPVKYSSSKFVYPLVSSSYANLKYQGNNKNYMTNKKPTSVAAAVTPASSYHSHNYYTVPTTKLMPVPPTAAGIYTTNKTGAKKPATTKSTSSTTTTTTTTTTSTTTTTAAPRTTPKYTTTTRKPTSITTTTQTPRTTTTRKKFVPTKKYNPSTTTVATASTPMRFPTEKPSSSSLVPRPTSTKTTVYPSKPSTMMTTSGGQRYPSTNQPIVFTESPSSPPVPTPNTTPRIPNLEAADVYQTLGQKHTEHHFEQKPSMTLADIFNSLADEESVISSHNQGSQGFDSQGNLMQPIEPSKPSPFIRPQNSARPTHNTTPYVPSTPPQQRYQPQQQQHQQQQTLQQQPQQQPLPQNDQKLISGSQENYSNEYVSYQVQQPNVLQYRPVPGAINNVVISPGQNSATFVLGSQQQVGVNAFGSIEKEPLFSKEPPVQYGTVISEDISSLTRPVGISTQNNFPTQQAAGPPPPTFQQIPDTQITSNFHQNGNFAHVSAEAESLSSVSNKYHETPPAAPTPYQQLPLIGTTKRPQKQQQQLPQQRPQSNPYTGYPQQNPNQLNQNEPTKPSLGRPQSASQHPSTQPASINISNEQETQELLVSTNIRFPATDEQVNEFGHSPLMSGPPESPQVNGHAQPLSLQQLQQSNTVVFPKTNEDALNKQHENAGNVQPNELIYSPGNVQIQQHEVLTMNLHKQKLNFPQNTGIAEQSSTLQHIPSQHMEPPPRFDPQEAPQKRPQTNRPQAGPHPPAYMFNEFTRKPLPGITRPNSERHLPNILPQFRPNAKISSGHSPTYNQEPGNIRIPSHQPPKRPNGSPQFAHRHQPMPQAQQLQQQRFSMKRIADYPLADANRRVYRQPPYGGQHPQFADRMYGRRPMPNGIAQPSADSYAFERHAVSSNPEPYKTLPQAMALEKLAAFEEEDLVINDPLLPLTASKETNVLEEDKLEPVVTLQMLQSHKKTTLTAHSPDRGSDDIQVPSSSTNFAGISSYQNQNQASHDGLYVVYPMRPDADPQDLNVAAESKDPMPAIAHIESAPTTGSGEYQNTPFSVLRDQPQEPILMVKNKKAQSLQQQTKYKTENQLPTDKFPYPIEKPDPSFNDKNMRNRMSGLLLAPRIINADYQPTGTVAPIALAYTPTEPNIYKNHAIHPQTLNNNHANKYSNVNLASSVISEIRHTDSQTEESLNNDFDFRGQNYEKDFMAPFYPSVSLGSATNAPLNGWNILPSSTDNSVFEKNNINRADVGDAKDNADSLETTTKTFELDSFQPELQGGFKPIYPPGYKMEDEAEEMHLHEGINMPVAMASRMELPVSLASRPTSTVASPITTSTTTAAPKHQTQLSSSSSTITSTTPATLSETSNSTLAPSTTTSAPTSSKPTMRKKSSFATSLAALLFGEEEDNFEQTEDIEARKDDTIKAVSGPRSNMPRSGPRNLKLS